MLWRGLPVTAPSRTNNPDDTAWDTQTELLAQLIEEVSVMAADHRRKKPREVPRPWEAKKNGKRKEGLTGSEEAGFTAVGLTGMLEATRLLGGVS